MTRCALGQTCRLCKDKETNRQYSNVDELKRRVGDAIYSNNCGKESLAHLARALVEIWRFERENK